MVKFKSDARVSLNTPPDEWEMGCINCGVSYSGYKDVTANFGPRLEAGFISHDLYCKACREGFRVFAEEKIIIMNLSPKMSGLTGAAIVAKLL